MLSATNQTDQSHTTNKEKATEKLLKLIEKGLVKPKKRRKVPIPVGVEEARLEGKKRVSEKKATRQTVRINPKE